MGTLQVLWLSCKCLSFWNKNSRVSSFFFLPLVFLFLSLSFTHFLLFSLALFFFSFFPINSAQLILFSFRLSIFLPIDLEAQMQSNESLGAFQLINLQRTNQLLLSANYSQHSSLMSNMKMATWSVNSFFFFLILCLSMRSITKT